MNNRPEKNKEHIESEELFCKETEVQKRARIVFSHKKWRSELRKAIDNCDWDEVSRLEKEFQEV